MLLWATLFPCLSIRLSYYDLTVPIFCFRNVLLSSHPVVSMSLHLLAGSFLSLFWKHLFCLYCLILSRYLFRLPSFASTFWFIFSSYIICANCVVLLFFSQHILAFFFYLSIFACRRFLICVSSRISHPIFEFLFVFYKGTPIFPLTNFAPSYIRLFNSVILYLLICLFFQFVPWLLSILGS